MEENKETLSRVAVCVVAALLLYYAVEKFSDQLHIPLLEKYKPWLEENKIQAVAIVAAILFGVSLAAFPLPSQKQEEEPLF